MEKVLWPAQLPVTQVRIARPTHRLQQVLKFYHEGLGLPIVDSFEGHAGYSGVMLGLPGHDYHLEFTTYEGEEVLPPPSKDHLLVLYIPEKGAIAQLVARLRALGYTPVPPENPYWERHGTTIEDPDGWRVVLMNTSGI